METRNNKTMANGDIELLQPDARPMTADAILDDFTHYFARLLGRRRINSESPYVYQSVVFAIRDRLVERWNDTRRTTARTDARRTAYLSLEYLLGRLLRNAAQSLGVEPELRDALSELGLELEQVAEREHDAGLGNGGLGRLAACFLDSCATLALPVIGYGMRYRYGMFRQRIDGGQQVEEPDSWLRDGFPWEIERLEISQVVRFAGRTEVFTDADGVTRHVWKDTDDVLAVPFDVPIPGYRNDVVNTLRLWAAEATDEFDLDHFNAGSYSEAVAEKNAAEEITMVLYPNDTTVKGKELRLRQQYFLVAASLQDTLRRWCERHGNDFSQFAERNCFQLNDTHPAIAVPELLRLLSDEHGLNFDDAWNIVTETMAYTNHTLLPEALEEWPVELLRRLLPRHLEIIYQINERLLADVARRWPEESDRATRMSLIRDESSVRMAYLAVAGSYSVNGVAALHSRLLRDGLFADFADLWPERFNNKTNGITQRRWLLGCNPALSDLITARIGDGWVTDLPQLEKLRGVVDDDAFVSDWQRIRVQNKQQLAAEIGRRTGISLDSTMMFDVQVKRIHEYKRQLLNVLHAVHLYDRLRRGDGNDLVRRAIIIGGKAAPGYVMAKNIIRCIHSVSRVINDDPVTQDRLRLVFFPDYNVSAMERICPAADLSEQISTAGKEASGTGNMKFMLNGAVTIGTLDGANIEILEAVGEENFFRFGHTVDEIADLQPGYDPARIIANDDNLARVITLFADGLFDDDASNTVRSVVDSIRNPADPWMTAADFASYVEAQQHVEAAWRDTNRWTRTGILNTAASGRFSADRTIREYNEDIWRLAAIDTGTT